MSHSEPAGRPHRLYTDGGARGNPGPGGIGVVLESPDGETVLEISGAIGFATNNVAEYRALITGMEAALERGVAVLEVYMDSKLVVEQMRGVWKVKHEGLKPLHQQGRALAKRFEKIRFIAIPRERNTHADRLMNEGIDAGESLALDGAEEESTLF